MKNYLLILLFLLAACSHKAKLKDLTHVQLADIVMKDSLLTNALASGSLAAPNCIQPFEASIPKPVYAKLKQLVAQNFKIEDMYKSIRERMLTASSKQEMLVMAQELNGETWKKFKASIPGPDDAVRFTKIYQGLDDGSFDLQSNRSRLVASITDHAFMVNLVRLSNDQVLKMFPRDLGKPASTKQKSVMDWIARELQTFNDAHIKALFANTYLTTEKMTEAELESLLKIRSHEVLKLGKESLEQELNFRYQNFFRQMIEFREGSIKR